VIGAIAPHDSQERFEGLGVRVIRAQARFVGPQEVEADGRRIRARRIVVATGSSPAVPPIPGLAEVPHLTNETVFDLTERPQHLIVIGGGPIGCEIAQAHRRLGAQVTVLELFSILPKDDPEAVQVVRDQLSFCAAKLPASASRYPAVKTRPCATGLPLNMLVDVPTIR
jgi:pyruvate/2-oxoglutarate dehydrogenase complex dihydrolipoamide dehydrogenase (E3) component